MIFPLLQVLAIAALAVAFHYWRASLRRRNARSWESMVARLRLDSGTQRLYDESAWNGSLQLTPKEQWQLVRGAFGLWAMFENAGVMMEMADYAARNSNSVDNELLDTLRSDAMQIRIYVIAALCKYAFSQVNESISSNVEYAVSTYAQMAARTTALLQASGQQMVPSFVATM